jgi:hypothetical protein
MGPSEIDAKLRVLIIEPKRMNMNMNMKNMYMYEIL